MNRISLYFLLLLLLLLNSCQWCVLHQPTPPEKKTNQPTNHQFNHNCCYMKDLKYYLYIYVHVLHECIHTKHTRQMINYLNQKQTI